MTDATQIVPIRHSSPLHHSEAQALAGELAKMLKLVAPSNMGAEQQTVWLHAAVDALDGIRAHEVADVSAELRRKVTRPAQIVPEIANLVAGKRARSQRASGPVTPTAAELDIMPEAHARRAKARSQAEIEEAWQWERSARADAGLAVPPIQKPFTEREIANMPAHIRQLGLGSGFLKRDGDRIVEVNDPREIDRIRAANR